MHYVLALAVGVMVVVVAFATQALLQLARAINDQADSTENIDAKLDVVIDRLTTVLVPEERT